MLPDGSGPLSHSSGSEPRSCGVKLDRSELAAPFRGINLFLCYRVANFHKYAKTRSNIYVFSPINAVFCAQGSGRFRERLVYVFHTFPNKSCNSTVLQRLDHQQHVVKLTFFVNMSKHAVQLTLFLSMCQNTSYNSHCCCQIGRTRRRIDIVFANE